MTSDELSEQFHSRWIARCHRRVCRMSALYSGIEPP
jgi:hypothetical protein